MVHVMFKNIVDFTQFNSKNLMNLKQKYAQSCGETQDSIQVFGYLYMYKYTSGCRFYK
jgi:hypothetical protein